MAGLGLGRQSASKSDASSQDSGTNKESRKPGNSDFKQQRLKAWQPILTASSVLPVFFFIGIVFLPIGIGLLVTSDKVNISVHQGSRGEKVQEKVIDYTNCNGCNNIINGKQNYGKTCKCVKEFRLDKKFSGPVYLYYGLSNFYQNHRRYVRSLDASQLHGNLKTAVSGNCEPFDKVSILLSNNQTVTKPVAPCGAIANSFFNDTFKLFLKNNSLNEPIKLSGKNIAWKSDVNDKFKNPSGNITEALKPFAKPPFWLKSILDMKDYFKNEDFIVWMRVAAFPTFRKLHRIISSSSLEAGNYKLEIDYNYPVSPFKGEKRVILSTSSWIGGKNSFLGIAYIVVGSICIACGIIFLFVHLKVRTRSLKNL